MIKEQRTTTDRVYRRHLRIWRVLARILLPFVRWRFHYTCDPIRTEGPFLLVCNHVSAWDCLFVAAALGDTQVYFMATETLERGPFGRILSYLVGPIYRKKGASALGAVRECVSHLKAGHNVALFGEGEQSWDGRNIPVVRGTGALVLTSGAKLVTYRLEGAFLSLPRWGKGIRRGRVRGRLVHVYEPQDLKGLKSDAVNALIDADIREDAYARQLEELVTYRNRNSAHYLERALFLCPQCRQIGRLKSRGMTFSCACGLTTELTETGFFADGAPFRDMGEWDRWQKEALKDWIGERIDDGDKSSAAPFFTDADIQLIDIVGGHDEHRLGKGKLSLYPDRLVWSADTNTAANTDADAAANTNTNTQTFPLTDIRESALVLHRRLLFTVGDRYLEARSGDKRACMRKFYESIRILRDRTEHI